MINKHRFSIVTNSAGQRIMIVGDDYRHFAYEPAPFEAFDAIYFETKDYSLLKRQVISLIAGESNPNYSFKALFIQPSITNPTALTYADGLITSIDAPELINETRRITDRFRSMKFKIFDRDPSFWTPENRVFHVIRTFLLRSDEFPAWQVSRRSALGYAIPRFEMLLRCRYATVKEVMQFLMKLDEHYKLLETKSLTAVIHVCPHCFDNRLLWQELCPKCNSAEIDEVQMIHHFRCANISSEESYLKDGKLVCPKCKLELKHIGVDYDRPASMYYCGDDKMHFSTPSVKALCTNCMNVNDLPELKKRKLYQLGFTALGRAAFAHYDQVIENDDIPKLPSIHSFSSFARAVMLRTNIARNNGDLHPVIIRFRVTPEDNYEMIEQTVIHRIYRMHPNAVLSYRNNTFYMLQSFSNKITKEMVDEILPIREFNKIDKNYTFEGDYIQIDLNMDIDKIIAAI